MRLKKKKTTQIHITDAKHFSPLSPGVVVVSWCVMV
jgi:hypothetical protein